MLILTHRYSLFLVTMSSTVEIVAAISLVLYVIVRRGEL